MVLFRASLRRLHVLQRIWMVSTVSAPPFTSTILSHLPRDRCQSTAKGRIHELPLRALLAVSEKTASRDCLENVVPRVTGAYAPHHGKQEIPNRLIRC